MKRIDEESTQIQAFQRTSPQDTAAERDGAVDMWKMASEQRTEPCYFTDCNGYKYFTITVSTAIQVIRVRLRQVPPVTADRVLQLIRIMTNSWDPMRSLS